jgi:hypothetical protein
MLNVDGDEGFAAVENLLFLGQFQRPVDAGDPQFLLHERPSLLGLVNPNKTRSAGKGIRGG